MSDEKVLLEALASSGFKLSVFDKNRTDALEVAAAEDAKKQFGEDVNTTTVSDNKQDDGKSLLSIFKGMSGSQREQVIALLKQNGLGDPLTKEKVTQNSFTVEKAIRDHASN